MTSLSNRLLALAKSWPKDPFRPNMQLGVFLESLSTHPKLTRKAVAATEALKNDVLKSKYPLRATTTRPASFPEHYKALMIGMEKSAQGIARPWWKRIMGIY